LKRINLSNRDPQHFFSEVKYQVTWQDGRLYRLRQLPVLDANRNTVVKKFEDSFDGSILYNGNYSANMPMLGKRLMSKIATAEPTAEYLAAPYFGAAGYHIPLMSEWDHPQIESELTYFLRMGGELKSAEAVGGSGNRLLRVTLIVPNPEKALSNRIDIEKEAENLKLSRETPERQKELLANLRRQQTAPDKRRLVYDLDPERHYAVTHWEQWYEPSTLLRRGECSQFQQLPGRQVWLPKRCEVQYFEFPTVPKTYFRESFLSEVLEVSGFDTSSVPSDRFVLAYTEPGTWVMDGTLPEAAKHRQGYIGYTIPAQIKDLDGIISRAKNGEQFSPGFASPPGTRRISWVAVFILANVFIACLIAFVCWYWRRALRPEA
jgi:hypothetical protein